MNRVLGTAEASTVKSVFNGSFGLLPIELLVYPLPINRQEMITKFNPKYSILKKSGIEFKRSLLAIVNEIPIAIKSAKNSEILCAG